MSVNVTSIRLTSLTDVTIVFSLFVTCVFICIILSIIIMFLIIFKKNLHSPMNLLVCKTCLDTIIYVIITIINTSFFYFEIRISDWWCEIQAYLNYATLNLVAYSYFIQALSRLFFTVLYKYRFLLNYKSHIILIICQTSISFILPLPNMINVDILYRPRKLCLIPMKHIFRIIYFLASTYFILLFSLIIIYTIIYRQVTRSTSVTRQLAHGNRRDIQLIRHILIIFMIYSFAGTPAFIYTIKSTTKTIRTVSYARYMFVMAASPLSTLIEKISLIFLNTEIKKALTNVLNKRRSSSSM
jgi:hypothetical protein